MVSKVLDDLRRDIVGGVALRRLMEGFLKSIWGYF